MDTISARKLRFLLIFSTLILGACGIAYEYALSVLGNHLIGSSHEEIFVVMGLMMFAMGLGAGFQRYIKKALFEKFLLLEILLGLVGGFSAIVIYQAFIHTESHRVILYIFSMGIGCLIGMEIPLIIRINHQHALNLKDNLSEILSMDYVGALAGALVFTYFLLTRFSLANITFMLGLVNVGVAILGFLLLIRLVPRKSALALGCLIAVFALGYGMFKAEDWMRYAEQRYYRDPIVLSETSKYQHLVLTKRNDRVQLFINGHLQFSSMDEKIYHEMLVHPVLALSADPKRVLILGGGDGLALREILKYPNVESVTLVDIDPRMVKIAGEHPDLVSLNKGALHDSRIKIIESKAFSPGEKVNLMEESQRDSDMFSQKRFKTAEVCVLNVDAKLFLRETEGIYDAAFIDLPDPDALELAKLYSVDFYSALRDCLAPNGFISVQSTSPFYAKDTFLCIGKSLASAGFSCLPYHENVPSFGEWGWYLCWKSKAPVESIRKKLLSLKSFDAETDYLTPEILKASLIFGKGWLTPTREIIENTFMNPVIVEYYRDAWKGV